MFRPNLFFIAGLAFYTLSMRLMPYGLEHLGVKIEQPGTFYPWNFSPMSAFCLFGAAFYARKWWAYFLPIAVLFAGDLGIWAISGKAEWAFHNNSAMVYGCFLLIAFLGMRLREKRSLRTVWVTGFVGEVLFFLMTNFGVWYQSPDDPSNAMGYIAYTKDAMGLTACYIAGLGMFGKSLASTLFFSTLIFRPFILKEREAAAIVPESSPVAVN